jgi:hypothetical protein
MGYTHYFRQSREFTEAEWTALTEYARKIVEAALCEAIELAGWDGSADTDPEITSYQIVLNGAGPNDYDTFMLTKRVTEPSFVCKTQRRPYDPVVVTILHAACVIAPDAITESSDGDEDDGALMFHFTDRVTPPAGPNG